MSEENNRSPKGNTAPRGTFIERLVRKTLSSVGGIFERPFQRDDENDALPSTSNLTDRLKRLIDDAVREQADGSRVAPHLIRLKYTWGETTDEFEANVERLKNEMLVVAIDHINDNRYRTIAPVKLEVKPDILSEGLTLAVGFDADDLNQAEKVEVPAEIFAGLLPKQEEKPEPPKPTEIEVSVSTDLPEGEKRDFRLHFVPNGKANLTVGRTKDNDLFLNHTSVSKLHASLVMNNEGKLRLADVGSTNGTFIDGDRLSYGKAYEITKTSEVAFGEVKCRFAWEFTAAEEETAAEKMQTTVEPNETVEEAETVSQNEPETAVRRPDEEPETVMKSTGEPETVFRNPRKDFHASNGEDFEDTVDFSQNKSDDNENSSSSR